MACLPHSGYEGNNDNHPLMGGVSHWSILKTELIFLFLTSHIGSRISDLYLPNRPKTNIHLNVLAVQSMEPWFNATPPLSDREWTKFTAGPSFSYTLPWMASVNWSHGAKTGHLYSISETELLQAFLLGRISQMFFWEVLRQTSCITSLQC